MADELKQFELDFNQFFPSFQQYLVLTLEYGPGDNRARLTVQGPKAPTAGVAPAIGVGRDADGNYYFLLGINTYICRPDEVPSKIRQLFGESGGASGGRPPTPHIRLPSRAQLRKPDGSFKSYEEYKREYLFSHSPMLQDELLNSILYGALIDLYSGDSRNYGDYAQPCGDGRYA